MDDLCFDDQETIREFLVECHENLSRLDHDIVELEKRPHDTDLLSGIFRTMHTIKGASGFLAFANLEKLTHQAENLLSQLRDGKREINPGLITLILETVDSTRKILGDIEANGKEGENGFEDLIERLRQAAILNVEAKEKEPAAKPAEQAAAASQPAAPPVPAPPAPAKRVSAVIRLDVPPSAAENVPVPPAVATPVIPPAAPVAAAPVAPPAPVAPAVPAAPPVPAASAVPPVPPQSAQASTWDGIDRRKNPQPVPDEEDSSRSSAADANIRVHVGLLDKLMDLVGELVLTRNQILQFNLERDDSALNATSQRLNLITSELQEGVMKTRMQPIGVVWNNLPRVVRDMAVSLGKQIEIKMDGAGTELDRTIIEAIKDPLIHLVRNACDHGIEMPEKRVAAGKPAQGTMTLRAYHEGGQVNIELADDGGGINLARVKEKAIENGLVRPDQVEKLSEREIINLIFQPGFSTAAKITNISGRGVGMDVVKSHIERIGGVVDISSRFGYGTTVKIRIPLTLAIIPGLVITSGGERFVIPQVSLLELIRLEGDASGKHIEYVHGTPVYRRRGSLLPVAYLNQVLGLKSTAKDDAVSMVVLQAEDRQFGLVVDGINDTQEIVVKALGKQLKGLTLYAGATIMGDGRVALILDVLGLGQRSGVFGESRERARAKEAVKTDSQGEQQQTLLLFQAGSFKRLAVPLSLVARLEEFPRTAIEKAGGGLVVQYRNKILPLISLRTVLSCDEADESASDAVQVVVFNDGDRAIGMVVDQILDVAEETVTARQTSTRRGLLGSAVVGKKVTDFLDLSAVIHAARESWSRNNDGSPANRRVLVADASSLSRNLIKTGLDMEGYSVIEAGSYEEALRRLETQSIDLVIASADLPQKGCSALVSTLRGRDKWSTVPVLAVFDSAEQARRIDPNTAGFGACEARYDTLSVVRSAAQLIADRPFTAQEPELLETR